MKETSSDGVGKACSIRCLILKAPKGKTAEMLVFSCGAGGNGRTRETGWQRSHWGARCARRRRGNLHKTVDKSILALEKQTCEYGGVAQLGEHLPCKQGVDSSILFISTTSCAGGKTRTRENDWEQW